MCVERHCGKQRHGESSTAVQNFCRNYSLKVCCQYIYNSVFMLNFFNLPLLLDPQFECPELNKEVPTS